MGEVNRCWRLKSAPEGIVGRENFELSEEPVPDIGDGELLVRNLWLSCDAAQRAWLDRDTYIPQIQPGEVMQALTAAEVVESKNPGYDAGDMVTGAFGWQDYTVSDASGILAPIKIPPGVDLPLALSLFGISGFTAYFGLLDVGAAKEGETVLVSGAAGSVGSLVVQIAKNRGCRVVGIAGGERKTKFLTDELGADGAIDYRAEPLMERIGELCPDRVDVFFDNVGGEGLDAALANLADGARVVLCGAISEYSDADRRAGIKNLSNLILHSASMRGFLVFSYLDRIPEAITALAGWLGEGKMTNQLDIVEGLENAPDALRRLFTGENLGKQLVKVADRA